MKIVRFIKNNKPRDYLRLIFRRYISVYNVYYINIKEDYTSISLEEINYSRIEDLKINSNEIDIDKINILKGRVEINEIKDFFLLINNDIIGHYGIALKNKPEFYFINNIIKLEDMEGYLFDDYTLKKYRNKGMHKKSVIGRLRYLKNNGFHKAKVIVLDYNIPSNKTYISLGFKKKEKIIEISILNKKYSYIIRSLK